MSLLNLNYFEIFGIEAQIIIDIEHLNKNFKTFSVGYLNKEFDSIKNVFVMGSRSNQLDRLIKQYVK